MEKCEKILELYFATNKLKQMLRQGWIKWHVEEVRLESIAEHIFGTIMLAISITANTQQKIDIEKVVLMLALHDLEEIIIGDIPFVDITDIISQKQKGKLAVEKLFADCEYKEKFLNLIEEFEEQKTLDAKFAYQCDKMEADLQAYIYKNNYDISKVDEKLLNDERILAIVNNGHKKICQFFLQNDIPKFDGTMLKLAQLLESLEND